MAEQQHASLTERRADVSGEHEEEDEDLEKDDDEDDDENTSEKGRRKQAKRMAKYTHWEQKHGVRLIAYVNSKAGGKAGGGVLKKLRKWIPGTQVHDLFEPFQGVEHTLQEHMDDADAEAALDPTLVRRVVVVVVLSASFLCRFVGHAFLSAEPGLRIV